MKSAKFRILELLTQEHETLITIADIARALNIAYSHAHKFTQELIEENVLETKKVGRSLTVSLNSINPLTRSYLAQIAYEKTQDWASKDPRSTKILNRLNEVRNDFLCAFLHGNRIVFITQENKDVFKEFRLRKVIQWKSFNVKQYENILLLAGAENYYSNVFNT